METKLCPACNKHKSLDDYHHNKSQKDGHHVYCKECFANKYNEKARLRAEAKRKRLKKENPELVVQKNREKYIAYKNTTIKTWLKNKKGDKDFIEKARARKKRWALAHPRQKARKKETLIVAQKRCTKCEKTKDISCFNKQKSSGTSYRQHCKDCCRQEESMRRRNNPGLAKVWAARYRKRRAAGIVGHKQLLCGRLRNLLLIKLKSRGFTKTSRLSSILGCTYDELFIHMGAKPEGNYQIDHIAPLALANNEEEVYKLFHYTNLRWLPAAENAEKGNKWTTEGEVLCQKLLSRSWF